MSHSPKSASSTDSGSTLVELLIYMVFSVIVLILVGGMLISALGAEKSVVSRSDATTAGQLVSQSVHSGVRNAESLQLTSGPTEQLLIAATVGGASVAATTCQAWYYTAENDGAVYYKRAEPVDGEIGTLISSPSSGDGNLEGWMLLAHGIAPLDDSGTVFTARASNATEESVSGAGVDLSLGIGPVVNVRVDYIFDKSIVTLANTIDVALSVAVGSDSAPVLIESTTILRESKSGSALCF